MALKVLFAASECVPFAKTGGLADVVGALPLSLCKMGVDVRVIMPLYRDVTARWRDQMTRKLYFYVNLGWRRQYVGLLELQYQGVTWYFIDNEYYFGRPYIYGLGGDEGERFAFFCRAVMEALPHLQFQPDVLHAHDWQTGMMPVLLERQYRQMPFYSCMGTMQTIHNLQYQGVFGIDYIEDMLGLGWDMYTSDKLEFFGACNFLKGGLTYADQITTVSPTYAQEIETPFYGERLDGLIRARANDVHGVLNGIDTTEYNPQTDELIETTFGPETLSEKAVNKASLQLALGLPAREDVPLIGVVSRLSPQKGFDLVEHVLEELINDDIQLAVLGTGDEKYVSLFNWAAYKAPQKVGVRIEMNGRLAHRIYAGADMFLMPSQFEPCGLSQMIALRYGTLPIVRETGGLRDTVLSFNDFTGEGNGFTFFNYNAHDMLATVRRACALYRGNKPAWISLQQRAMNGEYGWDASAAKYLALYEQIAAKRPAAANVPPAAETAQPEAPPAPKKRAAPKPKVEAPAALDAAPSTPIASKPAPKPRAAAKKKPGDPADANA